LARGFAGRHPEHLRAAGRDVQLLSLQGLFRLLSAKASETAKYQALNRLTLRGMWLTLEAYKDDPIAILLFENVPRIASRGRAFLDEIIQLHKAYGYLACETVHDCGEIGNLSQSRKRFLLVMRHAAKVPPFLYQPRRARLRGVGEIIGKLPMPGDGRAGPMHRVPMLQWKTWVRLAFVPAGKDWRALNDLAVEGGVLRDYGIMPERDLHGHSLGVCGWGDPAPTITSAGAGTGAVLGGGSPAGGCRVAGRCARRARLDRDLPGGRRRDRARPTAPIAWPIRAPTTCAAAGSGCCLITRRPARSPARACRANGRFAVADPRVRYRQSWGVRDKGMSIRRGWLGASRPANGAHCVADPRVDGHPKSVQLGVRKWDQPAACVKGDVASGPIPMRSPIRACRGSRGSTIPSGSCRSTRLRRRWRDLGGPPVALPWPIRGRAEVAMQRQVSGDRL
jgi:hypothetical protein